jgi:hypothetical protein
LSALPVLFVKKVGFDICDKKFFFSFFGVSDQFILRVFLNDIAYLFNNDEFGGKKASKDY